MHLFLALFSLLILSACGDDTDSIDVADTPLSGKVAGEAWTFASAQTNAFLSDEEGYWVDLYSAPVASCGDSTPAGPKLIILLPSNVGEYDFSPAQTMTFVVPHDGEGPMNNVASKGRLIVESITDTTITAAVHGIFDDDNEVDGRFTVEICQ